MFSDKYKNYKYCVNNKQFYILFTNHPGISSPTYCLTSCSSMVRAPVCQLAAPVQILAGRLIQSHLLLGELIKMLPTFWD